MAAIIIIVLCSAQISNQNATNLTCHIIACVVHFLNSILLPLVEKEVDKRSIATVKRANEERRQAATSKKVSSGSSAKATSLRDVIVGASSMPQIDRVSSMPNVVDGEERGRKKQPSKKQVPLTTGLPAVAGVLPPSTATRSASNRLSRRPPIDN